MPYIVTPGGDTRPVAVQTSPPIGVEDARYTSGTFSIERGAGLCLFSDGLVERRSEDMDVAMERFGSLAASLSNRPTASELFESTSFPGAQDDTSIVAVYRH
jgi:two-component system, chemotaxis family, sensor kinase Cph1